MNTDTILNSIELVALVGAAVITFSILLGFTIIIMSILRASGQGE